MNLWESYIKIIFYECALDLHIFIKLCSSSLMNTVKLLRLYEELLNIYRILKTFLDWIVYLMSYERLRKSSIAIDFASSMIFRVNRCTYPTTKRDLLRGHKGRFHSSQGCPLSCISTAKITFWDFANATLLFSREKTEMPLRKNARGRK